MNGPFIVAQASTPGSNTSGSVRVITLVKPGNGQAQVIDLGYGQQVKVDLSAIANEKITLVHVGEKLIILYDNQSTQTIQPFFDSMNVPLPNVTIDMGPGRDLSSGEFANLFPITTDQSVLPAAGDGSPASGASFSDPAVDGLGTPDPLPLLGPEDLPNFVITFDQGAQQQIDLIPTVSGTFLGIVEEEQLNGEIIEQPSLAGDGNEDINDADTEEDLDTPEDSDVTTHVMTGSLAGLVVGGDLPITFLANSAADGTAVLDGDGNPVTSIGQPVQYVFVSSTQIEGWTFTGDIPLHVFTLEIQPDGSIIFTLNDQIDHPVPLHDDGTIPQGSLEETLNLDLSEAVIAHDATLSPVVFPPGTIQVGVIDDTPITFETTPVYPQEFSGSASASFALDDAQQPDGNPGGNGDDGFGASLDGVLDIRYGADDPSQFDGESGTNPLVFSESNIIVTNEDGEQIPLDQFSAIYVDGTGHGTPHPISIDWSDTAPGGGTLTGTATGPDGPFDVFTLVVNPDGSYTFTLSAPLAHPLTSSGGEGGGTTPWEDNLNIEFHYTATDFDGDSVDGQLTINVDDDTPTIVDGPAANIVVDEDDIDTELSLGTRPDDGNGDGSYTGDPAVSTGGPAFVSGSLASLVSVGADGLGAFSFDEANFATLIGELGFTGLRSQGDLLSYHIDDGAGSQTLVADADGGTRVVFTLELFSNGDYEFKLFDQMDHDPPHDTDPAGFVSQDPLFPPGPFGDGATADQNTDLIDFDDDNTPPGEPRSFDIDQLNFGGLIQVTDGDHDAVNLDGVFTVSIHDDIPKLVHGEKIKLFANEDDISTFGDGIVGSSLGTSPDDGNVPDGSYTGNPAVSTGGPAFVSGTLGSLVESGADEAVTFSFTGNAVSYFLSLGLESQGRELSYQIVGDKLIGFVNQVGIGQIYNDDVDRLVFTFELTDVNAGDFEFKLYDQLDHDAPYDDFGDFPIIPGDVYPTADQNFDLVDDDHHSDVNALNFGHVLQATDYDGDSVILDHKVDITIVDDIPQVKCGEKVFGVVEEEHLHDGNEDFNSGPPDFDQDHPQQGNDFNDTTTVVSGSGSNSLASLIEVGADENGKFSFKDGILCDTVKDKNGCDVTSKGCDVKITDIDYFSDKVVLTATADGRDVFKLTIEYDGDWKFELKDQLDHHPYGDDLEGLLILDFSNLIEFTDFDGDSVCLEDCSFLIKVIDDVPIVHAKIVNHDDTVIVDETAGLDNDDTTDPTVIGLFSGVALPGSDPVGMPVPQYARDGDAVAGADISVGADENATVDWTLVLNGGDGIDSGLETTDGRDILLFKEGDLIVGRYDKAGDGDDDVNGVNSSDPDLDPAAFAIHIDDTGHVSIVQYVSLQHGDPGNVDENIFISSNKVLAKITVTDFDGDQATDTVDISREIGFGDDGPHLQSGTSSATVDEDDLDNFNAGFPADDSGVQGSTGTSPSGPTPVSATGSLAALVTVGADDPITFSFVSDNAVRSYLENLGLESKGQELSYDLNTDGVIIGFDNAGSGGGTSFDADNGDRLVFKLILESDGDYTFELYDQLDHDLPFDDLPTDGVSSAPGYDENTDLRDSVGGDVNFIEFGNIVQATDADGDSVTLNGKLQITIVDDIPQATGAEVCPEVGPPTVEQGPPQVANFVLVLDSSGSIDSGQLALIKANAIDFLTDLANSGGQDVRVHIVDFSTNSSVVGTFDLIVGGEPQDDAGDTFKDQLQAAIDAVNAITGGGNTNYEAALAQANEWITGGTVNVTNAHLFNADTDGGSDNDAYVLTDNNGVRIAVVSGWEPFGELDEASGNTSDGFGVNSGSELNDTDEMLRFDFGAANDFDLGDDYGLAGAAAGFHGSAVSAATFSFRSFGGGDHTVNYTIHYTDDSDSGLQSIDFTGSPSTGHLISADPGKLIDYIEFTVPGGESGRVDLESAVMGSSPIPNADVNEVIFFSDGEPNTVLTNSGSTDSTSESEALSQTANEIAAIVTDDLGPDQPFGIQAFGANADSDGLDVLDQIDSDDAVNITTNTGLSDALSPILANLDGVTTTTPTEVDADLTSLFAVGADENITFGMVNDVSALEAQDIKSGGVELTYSIVGNLLTAKAGADTVFTLEISPNGTAHFELFQPLDHVNGQPVHVDFSSLVRATDFDGDGVGVGEGEFCVEVELPFSVSGSFAGVVEEEHLVPTSPSTSSSSYVINTTGNEDTEDALPEEDTDTSPSGFDTVTHEVHGSFVVTGGDGDYVFALNAGVEGTPVVKVGGGNLTSETDTVLWHQINPGQFVGYVEENGDGEFGGADRVIFSLDITTTGSYTFVLYDNVDHPTATSGGAATEETIAIDLNGVVIVDDEDGNTAPLQGAIQIIDDTPVTTSGTTIFLDDENATVTNGIGNAAGTDDLPAQTVNGAVAYAIGADGGHETQVILTGAILPVDGDFSVEVSPDGTTLTISQMQNSVSVEVVQVTMTPWNGQYSVEQLHSVLHPTAGTSEEDVPFTIQYAVKDGDNDTAAGSFTIDVDDDTAMLEIGDIADTPAAADEQQLINGTWTLNEGADGVAGVTVSVAGGGSEFLSIPTGVLGADPVTSVVLTTATYGALEVFSDGTWTYQSGVITGDQSFSFTIAAVDGDNDPVSDTQTINIDDTAIPLVQSGTFDALVEEEQLGNVVSPTYASSFVGNEDTTAAPDSDDDTQNPPDAATDFGITTHVDFAGFAVSGGDGDPTFAFNSAIENTIVQFADGLLGNVTAQGDVVRFDVTDADSLTGYADANGNSMFDGGDRIVFTAEINNSTNGMTFSLWDNIDHHPVAGADHEEGIRELNFNDVVIASDPGVDPITLDGSIRVIDDVPVAKTDAKTVAEGGGEAPSFHLTYLIDVSASISDTQMTTALQAFLSLTNAYIAGGGDLSIEVIRFRDAADPAGTRHYDNTGGPDSISELVTLLTNEIANLNVFEPGTVLGSGTNYQAGLNSVESYFDTVPTGDGFNNALYFFTDGDPTEGSISNAATMTSYLTSSGLGADIAALNVEVHAFGVGGTVTAGGIAILDVIDNTDSSPINITNFADLESALIGTVGDLNAISGNILLGNNDAVGGGDDDSFGADGPGPGAGVFSITIDGVTYSFNGTNAITPSGSPPLGGAVLENHGTWMVIQTVLGGAFTFYFTDVGANDAGDWKYSAPENVSADTPELLSYVIIDGDGDKTDAGLTITVTNRPTITISDATVNEADGTATFTVTLNGQLSGDLTFSAVTADGTAKDGVGEGGAGVPDYSATNLSHTFLASGGPSQTWTVTVPITNDSTVEGQESLLVNLTGVSSGLVDIAGSDLQGVGTINDNDTNSFAINDVTVNEGTSTVTFTVTRSGTSAVPITINYATADNTAFDGVSESGTGIPDYAATTGSVVFAAGTGGTQTFTIPIVNNTVFEGSETFFVNLSAADPSQAVFSDAQGQATITDNDAAPVISIDDVSVNEGAGTITFTLTKTGSTAVGASVNYAVGQGGDTAGTPGDYTANDALSGTVAFLAGETTKTITLNIVNDGTLEPTETFTVNLSGAVNASIAGGGAGVGIGTITDNDVPPNVAPTPQIDTVIHNFNGTAFTVPEWAFLANDTDPDGGPNPLDISSIVSFSSLDGVTHTAGIGTDGTININGESGGNGTDGTFVYRVTDGAATGDAAVTVVRDSNNITGTNATEIIVGDGDGDTFTGLGGNDIILAGAGGDTIIGGAGADIIDPGADDNAVDHIQFASASEYGDTIINFDANGTEDVIEFTGSLNTLFDDGNNNDSLLFATGNGGGGTVNADIGDDNSDAEALLLTGTNGEGVANASLTDAGAVAAAFNAEFNITANNGNDALLVINDTDGNSASIWQYVESGGSEIQAGELTLIALVHSNAALTSGNLDLA